MELDHAPNENQPSAREAVCPACGAKFLAPRDSCWLCGWKAGDAVVGSGAIPRRRGFTFNLSTLFLWTMLLGVLMGVGKIAPSLGVGMGIISISAAVNATAIVSYRQSKSGRVTTAAGKCGIFAVSVAAFVFVGVALLSAAFASLVFFALCNAASGPLIAGTGALIVFAGSALFATFAILRGVWQGLT